MILTREEVIAALKHISHNELTGFNIAQAIEAAIIAKLEKAEPVAWKDTCITTYENDNAESEAVLLGYKGWENLPNGTDLYTHPLPAKPGWKPIDTAPNDGTKLLIMNDEGAMDVAGYIEQWNERTEFLRKAKDGDVYHIVREECGYWDTDTAYLPTHWMPLPAAPENE